MLALASFLLILLAMPQTTLIDGFNDQSGGMDASRTPEVITERNFALGVNMTARNGMPATRPMFRRVEMKFPETEIRSTYFQGSAGYYNPAYNSRLVLAAFAGRIYSFNPIAKTWTDLSAVDGLVNDATATHYFCQAESFMVIQSGRDGALIFDGLKLRRAGEDEVPTGTIMAYGQGRLWVVSPDFRSILGCDLVYGGSIASITILLSTPQTGGVTRITTAKPHGFTTGDTVTIQRHYSSPSIIGTWGITVLNETQFTIPTTTTAGASGGVALRSNEGVEADVLRATEYRFANEKGIFRLPAWMGKIRAVTFFPVQDTGTGQGDMLVGGESGACSFLVSAPRDTWQNIQIQRVALTEIGFGGHLALAQVNGDIFFGSRDGLRSYRNARAEFGTYGNTPLSAEIAPVLPTSSLPVLSRSSMALHDNRLLFTASPRVLASSEVTIPPRYIFQSLAALDFQQSSRISKGGIAAYDGVWTGLDVLQLVPANFGHEKRLYAWCWQRQNPSQLPEPVGGDRANELWEITTEDTGHDAWGSADCSGVYWQDIKASLELRALNFGDWKSEKRLTRLDFWIDNLRNVTPGGGAYFGEASITAHWRPDLHGGGWFLWSDVTLGNDACAGTYLYQDGAICERKPQIRAPFHVAPIRFGTPPQYEDAITNRLADRGFSFQVRLDWTGRLRVKKLLAYAEPLVDPTQGDKTARQLYDPTAANNYPSGGSEPPAYPIQMPPIGSREWSHSIFAWSQCNSVPCLSIYLLPTTGPALIYARFIADETGAEEIQVYGGYSDEPGLQLGRQPDGSYSGGFGNGFTQATATVAAIPPEDPDFTGPAVRIRLVPDVSSPFDYWELVLPEEVCLDLPVLATLDSAFTHHTP